MLHTRADEKNGQEKTMFKLFMWSVAFLIVAYLLGWLSPT